MKQFKSAKRILPVIALTFLLLLTGCNGEKKLQKAFSFSEASITVMEGETKTLTLNKAKDAKVGDYTVTWMSRNDSVAAVTEDGAVTGVSQGSTEILASVRTEKAEVLFQCAVTVTQNTTPLSGLSFSATVYSVGEGQTVDLKNEILPTPVNAVSGPLVWTSSNTNIATVSDGVVSPVSQGISVITATTQDGSVSATCTVRVSAISVPPTGIAFEEESYTVSAGSTLKLTPKITPENATGYTVLWTVSDPAIATVEGGTVKGVAEGEVTVTARLSVGDGTMVAECTVTVGPKAEVHVPATKVELSPNNMTIAESSGEGPFKFGLTVSPANCTDVPYWSCSDDDVLYIDPQTGEILLLNPPVDRYVSVVVTCEVGEISNSAVVKVAPRKPQLQIGLSDSSPEILYDKAPSNTIELVAGYADSEQLVSVTWTSSNPTVASVDSTGCVTGHKAGTCTITAVSKSNSSVKATYTVTVEKAPYISAVVGEAVPIDPDLIEKNDISWQCDPLFLELDTAAMTVKGLQEALTEPTKIFGVSASGGIFTIDVYVFPAE